MADEPFARYRGWRNRRIRKNRLYVQTEFKNPYPWMSATEARVQLWLQANEIPFSWRFFNGEAPEFQMLLPDFTPEFTLKDYKRIILILGAYYGSLPGVIDRNGLAAAVFEHDGWKVAVLWEQEIEADVEKAILNACPELRNAAIHGGQYMNPWGAVAYQPKRGRADNLKAYNLKRFKPFDPERSTESRADGTRRKRLRTRSRIARSADAPLPPPNLDRLGRSRHRSTGVGGDPVRDSFRSSGRNTGTKNTG